MARAGRDHRSLDGQKGQREPLAGYQIHFAQPVEASNLATVVASLAGRTRDLFA